MAKKKKAAPLFVLCWLPAPDHWRRKPTWRWCVVAKSLLDPKLGTYFDCDGPYQWSSLLAANDACEVLNYGEKQKYGN